MKKIEGHSLLRHKNSISCYSFFNWNENRFWHWKIKIHRFFVHWLFCFSLLFLMLWYNKFCFEQVRFVCVTYFYLFVSIPIFFCFLKWIRFFFWKLFSYLKLRIWFIKQHPHLTVYINEIKRNKSPNLFEKENDKNIIFTILLCSRTRLVWVKYMWLKHSQYHESKFRTVVCEHPSFTYFIWKYENWNVRRLYPFEWVSEEKIRRRKQKE